MSFARMVGVVAVSSVVAAALGYTVGSQSQETQEAATGSSPVLAEWSGGEVTAAELSAWLETKPAQLRGQFERGPQRMDLLNELIDVKLSAAEARRSRLVLQPSVALELESVLSKKLLEAELHSPRLEPTEADLKEWFDAHHAEFERPEMIRVRLISKDIGAGSTATETTKQMQALADGLRSKQQQEPLEFNRSARTHSDDPSKNADGDLGWTTREDLVKRVGPAAVDAAWSASLDTVIGPVIGPDGVRVIRIEGRRAGASSDFATVKSSVRRRLLSERREETVSALKQRLRAQAKISIHEEQLDAMRPTSR